MARQGGILVDTSCQIDGGSSTEGIPIVFLHQPCYSLHAEPIGLSNHVARSISLSRPLGEVQNSSWDLRKTRSSLYRAVTRGLLGLFDCGAAGHQRWRGKAMPAVRRCRLRVPLRLVYLWKASASVRMTTTTRHLVIF